jgi:hypothetical protein
MLCRQSTRVFTAKRINHNLFKEEYMRLPVIRYSKEYGFMFALKLAGPKSIGIEIKRESQMLFSQRNGYKRKGIKIGPWYFNTLRNKFKKPDSLT